MVSHNHYHLYIKGQPKLPYNMSNYTLICFKQSLKVLAWWDFGKTIDSWLSIHNIAILPIFVLMIQTNKRKKLVNTYNRTTVYTILYRPKEGTCIHRTDKVRKNRKEDTWSDKWQSFRPWLLLKTFWQKILCLLCVCNILIYNIFQFLVWLTHKFWLNKIKNCHFFLCKIDMYLVLPMWFSFISCYFCPYITVFTKFLLYFREIMVSSIYFKILLLLNYNHIVNFYFIIILNIICFKQLTISFILGLLFVNSGLSSKNF